MNTDTLEISIRLRKWADGHVDCASGHAELLAIADELAALQPAAAQPQGDMGIPISGDAREAFEAWANNEFYGGIADVSDTWSKERGLYTDAAHHMAWHAWQAARPQGFDAGDMASAAAQGFRDGQSSIEGYTAGDMATAAADGFRGGVASTQASEPVRIVGDGFVDYISGGKPARAVEPLTDDVINAARLAMNESYEIVGRDIALPSHLAASLSLCLDEYDRAHGIGIPATTPTQAAQGARNE